MSYVLYADVLYYMVRQRVQGGGDNDETGGFSEKAPEAEADEEGLLRRVALAMPRQPDAGSSTPGSAEKALTPSPCNTYPALVCPYCHETHFYN